MVEVRTLTTDAVIVLDEEVVLLERDHPPYDGCWVLPGGLVERDETALEVRPRNRGRGRARRHGRGVRRPVR